MKTPPDFHKVIENVHPALRYRVWTYKDIMELSSQIGVNPQTMMGIFLGTIYPHEVITQRLHMVLDEDVVNQILEDYNPLRHLQIVSNEVVTEKIGKMSVYPEYLAIHLKKNDLVKLDTGDWLRVSGVKVFKTTVIVYSNGVSAFTCGKKDTVVALKRSSIDNLANTVQEPESWNPRAKEKISEEGRRALLENIMQDFQNKHNS